MSALWPSDPGRSRNLIVDHRLVEGALDLECLRDAVGDVVRRHEGLRLLFETLSIDPTVRVANMIAAPLEVEHLDRGPVDERAAAIEALIHDANRRCIDLTSGTPWRLLLTRVGPTTTLITVTWSHIVADGWAPHVFADDLFTAYRHRLGLGDDFHEPAPTFAELHGLQRERLAADEQKLAYWARLLSPTVPNGTPLDGIRRDADLLAHRRVHFLFDERVVRELRRVAWRARTTPFVGLLAAYYLRMMFSSGKEFGVIGSASHARTGRERAAVFQCVSDPYLPIACTVGDSVIDVIATTHEALGAGMHNLVSFKALARAVHGGTDIARPWSDDNVAEGHFLSSAPYAFEAVAGSKALDARQLVARSDQPPEARWADQSLRVTKVHLPGRPRAGGVPEVTPADLTSDVQARAWESRGGVGIEVYPNRLGGMLRYNPDLHSPERARRVLDEFLWTVGCVASSPDQQIGDLRKAFLVRF